MSTGRCLESALSPFIANYLALKRGLGREFRIETDTYRNLTRFLCQQYPANPDLTPPSFAAWTGTLAHLTPTVRRARMRVVRNLCLYRQRTQPECFVPDAALFPSPHQPLRPHIFSDAEILRLLNAAAMLQPTVGAPLRPSVFRLSCALLYTTGMRRGELVRMTIGDYDPRERTLLVRESKFHKSRLLPLSGDAVCELQHYLEACRLVSRPMGPQSPLLWNCMYGGRQYSGGGLAQGMTNLFTAAGIRKGNGQTPRVHDLRHTFAVTALLRWYRDGIDIQTRLPALSTYMGHVSIVSTQHYLQFIEEIADRASERFAALCADAIVIDRTSE